MDKKTKKRDIVTIARMSPKCPKCRAEKSHGDNGAIVCWKCFKEVGGLKKTKLTTEAWLQSRTDL